MYKAFGVLLIVLGAAAGLYFGFWLGTIGGLVDILNLSKSAGTSALAVASGVVKFALITSVGGIVAALGIVPGAALIKEA